MPVRADAPLSSQIRSLGEWKGLTVSELNELGFGELVDGLGGSVVNVNVAQYGTANLLQDFGEHAVEAVAGEDASNLCLVGRSFGVWNGTSWRLRFLDLLGKQNLLLAREDLVGVGRAGVVLKNTRRAQLGHEQLGLIIR